MLEGELDCTPKTRTEVGHQRDKGGSGSSLNPSLVLADSTDSTAVHLSLKPLA